MLHKNIQFFPEGKILKYVFVQNVYTFPAEIIIKVKFIFSVTAVVRKGKDSSGSPQYLCQEKRLFYLSLFFIGSKFASADHPA